MNRYLLAIKMTLLLFLIFLPLYGADSAASDCEMKYENLKKYNDLRVVTSFSMWRQIKIGEQNSCNWPFSSVLNSKYEIYSKDAKAECTKSKIFLVASGLLYIGGIYALIDGLNYSSVNENDKRQPRMNIFFTCYVGCIGTAWYGAYKHVNALEYYDRDLRKQFKIDQ